MDKIIYFLGIACSIAGVGTLLYQGVTYLSSSSWTPLSLIFLVEKGPAFLQEQIESSDRLYNAFEACPLFLFLIILGLLIMFIGSRFGSRYTA